MPPMKPVYGLRCESVPDRTILDQLSPCVREKRGNKRDNYGRERARPIWRVKFPKLQYNYLPTEVARDIKTKEPSANRPKKAMSHKGKIKGASTAPTEEDIFLFSERSDMKASSEKEKAKQSVLRTISKMLEENHLIRNRMAALHSAS